MTLSKSNIAYNLEISPHTLIVDYGSDKIKFYFSSALYRCKFTQRLHDNRVEIQNSLNKRFGLTIDSSIIADIRLYSKIEKRGFLVETNGGKYTCQDNIILDGLKTITND